VYIKEPKTRRNFVVFGYSKGGNKCYINTGTFVRSKQSKDPVKAKLVFVQCKTTDYEKPCLL